MYDVIIVGGGIVGVATAWQLQVEYPRKKILLLEKECDVGLHQTGHNSGVIHAGVYYAPGSLKAEYCKRGAAATKQFCREHGIRFNQCGKLLVASSDRERERMEALYERCHQNGVSVECLSESALRKSEPNIIGLGAIYVSDTAIVDYRLITQRMVRLFVEQGGAIAYNARVVSMSETNRCIRVDAQIPGEIRTFNSRFLISCGGLMADRLTRMLGLNTDFQIIPYRGEYYRLASRHNDLVKHLIYPIPDPELPFLGVHITRMIDGSITVGPNAVQGFKREGYGRINIHAGDVKDMVCFPGFWRVSRRHIRTGLCELFDSWYKPGYLRRVKQYCPQLKIKDLKPYPAGIRAQAVLRGGELVHDFLFAQSPRSLHVCNAPSPAATSAIPIARHIRNKFAQLALGD